MLADTEEVRQLLQDALDDVNARLARHETIKRFAVLGTKFAVDTGELTTSRRPCRARQIASNLTGDPGHDAPPTAV